MKAYNHKKKPKHWTRGRWKKHGNCYYFKTIYSKNKSNRLNSILISWIVPIKRYTYSKAIYN